MRNAPVTPLVTAPRPNPSYPTRPDPAYKGVSSPSIVPTEGRSHRTPPAAVAGRPAMDAATRTGGEL